MQYYCLELTRALCSLSFLSGSSGSCKQIYHRSCPSACSSNSVEHCSKAMQKKMQEKALLPSHKDVQGRLRPISAAHLPHTEPTQGRWGSCLISLCWVSPSSYLWCGHEIQWEHCFQKGGLAIPTEHPEYSHCAQKTQLEKDDMRAVGQPVLARTKTHWPSSYKPKDL